MSDLSDAVRVFVVAEVLLYREGLTEALRRQPAIVVAGAARDATAIAARIAETRTQVVVFDTSIAEPIRVFRDIARMRDGPRIVALAMRDDEDDVAAYAAAGVSGFVGRQAPFEELVSTIATVARGDAACSASILAKVLHRLAALAPVDTLADAPLTAREREIFRLVDEGLSNKEIADRLSIELSTVKNHVHNVLDKLEVHRRSDAVARVRQRATGAAQPA